MGISLIKEPGTSHEHQPYVCPGKQAVEGSGSP